MTLTKSFALLLGLVAGLLAAGVVGLGAMDARSTIENTRQTLQRDLYDFEMWMRIDASSRAEALASVAVDPTVRATLSELNGRANLRDIDPSKRKQVEAQFGKLNESILGDQRADMLIAVDENGFIAAQLGGQAAPAGAGLGGMPVVKAALAGYVLDDVWLYGGQVYRIAARPVIDHGEYVGAVIHASRFDSEFAERIGSQVAGAKVIFFQGDAVLSQSTSESVANLEAESLDALTTALPKAGEEEQLGHNLDLPEIQAVAAVTGLRGAAADARLGVAFVRPAPLAATPLSRLGGFDAGLVDSHGVWLIAALVLGLLMGMLGFLLVWTESDKPQRRLLKASEDAEAKLAPIDVSSFRGHALHLSRSLNRLIERCREAESTPRAGADLDTLLGSAPDNEATPDHFSFPPPKPAKGPDGPSEALPWDAAGPKSAPAAPPPPPPAPPAPEPTLPSMPLAEATRAPEPPQEAPAPDAAPPAEATDLTDDDGDDEATVMRGPAELPAAPPASPAKPATLPTAEAERPLQALFDEYLKTKKACGEDTQGLSYERFSRTIEKNTAQIKSKHGATDVKFTVYVKEGRAALKAHPVNAA